MLGKGAGEEVGQRLALLAVDDDEAPWGQLAMVGRAHRDGEDSFKLFRRWSGRDEVARLPRPAGFEQREG